MRARIAVLAVLVATQIACTSHQAVQAVDERTLEDRVTFTILAPDGESLYPGAEVFFVGGDWGRREDYVGRQGEWAISRAWLLGAELVLFCYPDGAFECAAIDPSTIPGSQSSITVVMPEAKMRHREILIPREQ